MPGNIKSHNNRVENLAAVTRDSWVFAGSKRVHTHDVRALTVASPLIFEKGMYILILSSISS